MSDGGADRDRLRHLRRAARAGVIPDDLLPLILELAEASDDAADVDVECEAGPAAAEALSDDVADELGRVMAARGATPRSLTVPPRTIRRLLRGQDALLSSVAAAAHALGCRVRIVFEDVRGAGAHDPAAARDGKIDPGVLK